MGLGDSAIDVDKSKSNGSALNRGKKRQLKSNGAAWGKLLSQCSQVGSEAFCMFIFDSCRWVLLLKLSL